MPRIVIFGVCKGLSSQLKNNAPAGMPAFIDHDAAERLFRAKVIAILAGEGLLSDERARVLLGWNHNSGFSVDDSVRFAIQVPGFGTLGSWMTDRKDPLLRT